MAPRSNYVSPINVLEENTEEELLKGKISKGPFLTDIVWPQAISISLFLIIGTYVLITFPWIQNYKTAIFGITYGYASNFGVTMGVHRYFAHKAFQVKKPLKLLMLLLFAMAGQYPIYNWVLDHRMHHKFSDKLGDPHNAKRGFFFCHVGWLMMKKDSIYKNKNNLVDMEDIKNDPYVRVFDKYYVFFAFIFAIFIPTLIPIYFWNETFYIALKMTINRIYLILNVTWSVNSFAHIFGNQTYNTKCFPKENLIVSILTNGEGYHNFHHTFPWDYKACEKGKFNTTAFIIRCFSKLGWAYDLKETDSEYIKKIVRGCGDQTHQYCKEQHDDEYKLNNEDGSMPREIPYENAIESGIIGKQKET